MVNLEIPGSAENQIGVVQTIDGSFIERSEIFLEAKMLFSFRSFYNSSQDDTLKQGWRI